MADKKSVLLEIITPGEMVFRGDVTILGVKTYDGLESFEAGHNWVCKPLAKEGIVTYREAGETEKKKIKTFGGHVDIKNHFVVYADKVEK